MAKFSDPKRLFDKMAEIIPTETFVFADMA